MHTFWKNMGNLWLLLVSLLILLEHDFPGMDVPNVPLECRATLKSKTKHMPSFTLKRNIVKESSSVTVIQVMKAYGNVRYIKS